MLLTPSDLQAIGLTLQVATLTTLILLVLGVPLAWWLARSTSAWSRPVGALVSMPLVLPPSVLGFYLLVLMGPNGPVGQFTQWLGLGVLTFSFTGLVIASVFYSLPFMVQPVQNAMQALGTRPLEAAASLRASPVDTFFHVVLPLCKPGLITGTIMAFAHTVGEFGVVLMVGGNIPGVTRVVSVQIFDHVEALEYGDAHRLAAVMLGFSFVVLLTLQLYQRRQRASHP
ncbi:molybdate ABC transporter permease subunit [Hydrogenophaga sp. IBVHS1]|uniref:molybdate ABC transporter permease subunit n=1 Tax=unclassified Hydrogenophaga TaxID=2610897 RepID=UPI000A2E2C9C|nr:molybdate ABC transporter permease subunit [Hydrogenophaga sp. IBVHS1]OSZ76021.1 molybdenum ABC transporter permease subunit [Hydrogenophaga sp. IBVHS1]